LRLVILGPARRLASKHIQVLSAIAAEALYFLRQLRRSASSPARCTIDPSLSICGGGFQRQWPKKIREAAAAANEAAADRSIKATLLQDIRWVFNGCPETDNDGETVLLGRAVDRISSEDLVKHLIAMEGQPWAGWNKGRGLTQDGLARLLKGFQIKSTTIRFADRPSAKGYYLDGFKDAFGRYLPRQAVTSLQANKINDLEGNQAVTKGVNVTAQNEPNTLKNNDCYGVTPEYPSLKGKGMKRTVIWARSGRIRYESRPQSLGKSPRRWSAGSPRW
jgi:hypothetical protein